MNSKEHFKTLTTPKSSIFFMGADWLVWTRDTLTASHMVGHGSNI